MSAGRKKKGKKTLQKQHGKIKSKTQESKVPESVPDKPETGNTGTSELSRNELMLQAKAKGIKNFRVINKQELVEILKEETTPERINEIVAGAVARWRKGWGTGKRKEKIQA